LSGRSKKQSEKEVDRMIVKLGRGENGKFIPVPQEELLANLADDIVETRLHGNEPLSAGSFLDAAIEGCNMPDEKSKGN